MSIVTYQRKSSLKTNKDLISLQRESPISKIKKSTWRLMPVNKNNLFKTKTVSFL